MVTIKKGLYDWQLAAHLEGYSIQLVGKKTEKVKRIVEKAKTQQIMLNPAETVC